jgi:hypothetical protein
MEKSILKEYYKLGGGTPLKTKNGKGFQVVYVDPKLSTDNTFDNKELMKSYGMEYLPYNRFIKYAKGVPHAWGWVIWDGRENEVYPLIKKFAEEIGEKETAPEGSDARTIEEVLASIEPLKQVIMSAESSGAVDGKAIIANAEKFKEMLSKGIGSEETMAALAELMRFRNEMKRHMGHSLSFLNTLLVWIQKKDARDVRSKGEWADMGYTPKPDATPLILSMPSRFKQLYGDKYEAAVRNFLKKEGVDLISDLTPSQKRRLDRATKYPDPNGGFKPYLAYDVSDMIAGEGAEEFPENNFKWYDKDTDETNKEKRLIDACIMFGMSIGIKAYEFVDNAKLGGSRGNASNKGYIQIADDKRNHGLLSTVIHETAHQIMHWEVVHTAHPNLKRFYQGGSMTRGSEIVEQEAELCAWLVLSGFGYENQQEHFNYLGNWGMTVDNCNKVFDSIMKVAQFIYDGMEEQLNNTETK